MDISNFVVEYRLMRKEISKRYKRRNPMIPMLIILLLILLLELVVGALQVKIDTLLFSIISLIFYVVVVILLGIVVRQTKRKEALMLNDFFKPAASYRIKCVCILLIKNGLDYKDVIKLDNLIYACDYQREEKNRNNQLIPSWMWTAIIGPIIMFGLKIYWDYNSEIFYNDIVTFVYCLVLIILFMCIVLGTIRIVNTDYYGLLKHDLLQLKIFNEYYSKFDEIYQKIIQTEIRMEEETLALNDLYRPLLDD